MSAAAISLRPYQMTAVQQLRASYGAGNRAPLFQLATGGGKCLGRGTPVLMFDGTTRNVEEIQQGDLLMGPDSAPREVVSLARGREMLYRVTPVKGAPYVVNESHILSLKRTATHANPKYPSQRRGGEVVNVSVRDYLASSVRFRHLHKGWRASVDFPSVAEALKIDPYFLGLWLGDGSGHEASITTADEETAQCVIDYAKHLGMRVVWRDNSDLSIVIKIVDESHRGRGGTRIMNALREYSLVRNKHIPHIYKTANRADRLAILAGIIDTDGHYSGKGYDLTLKSERLIDDAIFVARSLGLAAYKSPARKTCTNNGVSGDYWRCNISGDIDEIPCRIPRKKAAPRRQKKSPLVTGISVDPVGVGDYFGFELAGPDSLFLLGDFTVTHNTYVFCYVANGAASLGNRSLILVHRKELLTQASSSLARIGLPHSIIAPDKAIRECMSNHVEELSRPFVDLNAPVGVASVDTLINRLGSIRAPFLIIPDESHHAVPGNKWGKVIAAFPDARLLGVTATPTRSDGRGLGKPAGGFFDDLICGPQMRELIAAGALLQPTVFAPPMVANLQGVAKQAGDYATGELAERMDKPAITGDAVAHYRRICPGVPAIAFCVSVAHAQHVAEQFRAAGFDFRYIDGKMESNERRMLIRALARGKIHGLTSCDLISEGTDIPVVGCGILLRPTMSLVVYLQQVGRILRPSPGQDRAYILDHVGNCMIHGLPEADREWSLEGRKKKTKKAGDAEPVVVNATCPKCYAIHVPAPKCPQCGHVYENHGRQVEQQDGELQEVTGELAAALRKVRRQEEGRATTYDDFLKLGRERKYDNPEGWARVRVSLRNKRQSINF